MGTVELRLDTVAISRSTRRDVPDWAVGRLERTCTCHAPMPHGSYCCHRKSATCLVTCHMTHVSLMRSRVSTCRGRREDRGHFWSGSGQRISYGKVTYAVVRQPSCVIRDRYIITEYCCFIIRVCWTLGEWMISSRAELELIERAAVEQG